MLQAFLRGKLSPEQENLEDLLTSTVFGLLAYLPEERGLLPLLRLAVDASNATDAALLAGGLRISNIEFWPSYKVDGVAFSTEPDVVIWAQKLDGSRHIFLLEVKLWAAKSSYPDTGRPDVVDQLGREWCVLADLCKREDATPHLVYVTGDPRYPRAEVNEALGELEIKVPEVLRQHPFRCSWLSWLRVMETFHQAEEPALRDVAAMCLRLDLVPFYGFTLLEPMKIGWGFAAGDEKFQFVITPVTNKWIYR